MSATGSGQGRTIELSSAARNNPLFPALDFLIREAMQIRQSIRKAEETLQKIENNGSILKDAVDELKELQEKQMKTHFNLKDAGYQVPLRSGIAALYCKSIIREIKDEEIQSVVKSVLKRDSQHGIKVEAALKYCKHQITVFKTEERRRVLGIPPCQRAAHLTTKDLAGVLLNYMKAPQNLLQTYQKNLALLRKFIREVENPKSIRNLILSFKEWVNDKFVDGEIDWNSIMNEDEKTVYTINPLEDSSMVPEVGRSLDVHDNLHPEDDAYEQDSGDDTNSQTVTYSFN